MSNPYGAIFSAPGAKGFAAAGFFARMPMAMAPIGIVAMLSQTHGEYWLAGAVSAPMPWPTPWRRRRFPAPSTGWGRPPC